MSTNETPCPEPSEFPGPDSIRAILKEFLHERIEAARDSDYVAGFEAGYRLASEELRQGLEDALRQGFKNVRDREIVGRITDRVDHQRRGGRRSTRPLTKREMQYVEHVARCPNGITATEYRTQTERANVGLYKLAKRGVLVKRGARFYVPVPPEPNLPAEG
jgi:hypothetical protein